MMIVIITMIMMITMISDQCLVSIAYPMSEELAKRFPRQLQSIAAGGSALKLKYHDDYSFLNIMMITLLLVEYCIFEIVMILMIRKPAGEGEVCPRARSHCGRKL